MIARQRLTMQLVTWLTGNEHIFTSVEELLQLAEDPQVKKNVTLAFSEAAEELGLGRDRREEVVQYIEVLAQELAYIEAERDIFIEVKKIDEKIQGIAPRLQLGSRHDRHHRPGGAPVPAGGEAVPGPLRQVDAQTGEILSMLKNIDNQIEYIRQVRDDLYRRLRPWEDTIRIWKTLFVVRSDENTNRIRDIYQFLAPRYMQVNEWVLVDQARHSRRPNLSAGSCAGNSASFATTGRSIGPQPLVGQALAQGDGMGGGLDVVLGGGAEEGADPGGISCGSLTRPSFATWWTLPPRNAGLRGTCTPAAGAPAAGTLSPIARGACGWRSGVCGRRAR